MVTLDCAGRPLDLGRVAIMGILNVTPDSFSDGGFFLDTPSAVEHARQMVSEGAHIIDVGGESTRPGAVPISVQQELDRVIPVIERLVREVPVTLSVDSTKPEIMRAAVAAGAGLINDVNALQAEDAMETVAELGVPVCLTHRQGDSRTMQANPVYADVVAEVLEYLEDRCSACIKAGIAKNNIIIDPGFGFGKTPEHNLELLRNLHRFTDTGFPVLAGLSRKSLIGKLLDLPVERRVNASVALAVMAVEQGARIVRVHDVAQTSEAIRMVEAVYPVSG